MGRQTAKRETREYLRGMDRDLWKKRGSRRRIRARMEKQAKERARSGGAPMQLAYAE